MSHLYFSEEGSSVHKDGETILLKKEGITLFQIELKNTETIQIFGNVNITTNVVRELMFRGIELAYYKNNGELIGQLTPVHVKNIELRYKQYHLYNNEKFKLEFGKEIIKKKFESCIEILGEGNKNRDEFDLSPEINKLKEYFAKLKEVETMQSILGVEGIFAKEYYSIYGKLFKDLSLFQGRSKRPPKDEANALMSFLYTLMTNRISSFIDGLGFDPYLGFYHSLEYGRVSLACDLVEPIRAIFCDRLVLRLFNLKIIQRKDFEFKEEGIRLTDEGRKKFFAQYAEELNKEKNYLITKGNFSDYIKTLSQWLRKIIEQETVIPFE